jgi:hypothetical protein
MSLREVAVSGYPDSHLAGSASRRMGSRSALLLGAVPVVALLCWFGYLWSISGVLPSIEKYPSGKTKAEGSVKRSGIGDYHRQGAWTTYHENGQRSSEGLYDMGKKVGTWRYWDDRGATLESPESVADPSRDRKGVPRDAKPVETVQ